MIRRRIIKVLLALAAALLLFILTADLTVVLSTRNEIRRAVEITQPHDFIIVLGCGVYDNSVASPLLAQRLDTAIELYNKGIAPVILMSGDHREDDYNEVGVMKAYAVDKGVPDNAIILDDYGLSTSDTMRRAAEIFDIHDAVIVTQKYHLYRALYLAGNFDISCTGADATGEIFRSQILWSSREILARVKDFVYCIVF